MPGLNDAKIIIDASAVAVAKGKNPIAARCRAISKCASNLKPEILRGFAVAEFTFEAERRRTDLQLIEEQDRILEEMMADE